MGGVKRGLSLRGQEFDAGGVSGMFTVTETAPA